MSSAGEKEPTKKRKKRDPEEAKRFKKKHQAHSILKAHYNVDQIDNYIQELNSEINDAMNGVRFYDSIKDQEIKGSLIGATYWTSKEKLKFFNSLAVYPQYDLENIAAAVGKSAVECQAYLLLLQDATKEFQMTVGDKKAALDMRSIPSALEISSKLNLRLNLAAEMIEDYRLHHEEDSEIAKHGDKWILDKDIAASYRTAYKEHMKHPEIEKPKILDDIPSAELLKLHTFLNLSDQLFFKHRENSKNKKSMLYRQKYFAGIEEPSIRLTAFNDFHSIVVNLTRKLISAVLFQANTRIRAYSQRNSNDVQGHLYHVKVQREDVNTAIDILGLKRNSVEHWKTVSRRLEIDCGVKTLTFGQSAIQRNDLNDVNLNLPKDTILDDDQVEIALSANPGPRFGEPLQEIKDQWAEISAKIWDIEKQKCPSGESIDSDDFKNHDDYADSEDSDDSDNSIDPNRLKDFIRPNSDQSEETNINYQNSMSDTTSSDIDPLDIDHENEIKEMEALELHDKDLAEIENERLMNSIGVMSNPIESISKIVEEAKKNSHKPKSIQEPGPNSVYKAITSSDIEESSENESIEESETGMNYDRNYHFHDESQCSQWRDKTEHKSLWEKNLSI